MRRSKGPTSSSRSRHERLHRARSRRSTASSTGNRRPTRSSARPSRSCTTASTTTRGSGIYLVEEGDLVLGPWKGPQATDHVRIPIGQGVCGAAAASGATEIVDDVNADERYLACFPSTRSEIVVPIVYEGKVVGEIDIDSDTPAAFGPEDATLLERVAVLISPHSLVGWDTGGVPWQA